MIAYVVCRALTLLVLAVADRFTHRGILGGLAQWDGTWFLKAAQQGWPRRLPMVHGHVAPSTLAFFPVFPLAVRALHDVTGLSPVLLGALVSAVTGLSAVVGVGMVTRRFAGEQKAQRAALLFAVFPGTFVFSLLYSEGIVITCVAFGLLALLRRRWVVAGLLGALATGASPIGMAFVVSCAWCAGVAVVRHRDWRALAAPVLAPVGLVAWMAFLWRHTGVVNAWRLAERGGWQSYPSLVYPLHIVARFAFDPIRPTLTGQILFAGTVVGVVGVVLAVRQHQPAPVLLYGVTAAVLAAIAAPVGLRPRFLMLAFPLVVAYGTRFEGRTYRCMVGASFVLLCLFSVLSFGFHPVFP